jgi:hypothetical protein
VNPRGVASLDEIDELLHVQRSRELLFE